MKQRTGQRDLERIREATDLVQLISEHITLRPRGREHIGLCPFHDDHTPSMAVVTHKGNAFYKCHACGAGGDAFDFVQQYHKLEFREALRYLADRAGIELEPVERLQRNAGDGPQIGRADLRDANALAADFYQRVLQSEAAGKVGRDILVERNISPEIAEQFMLGLAPDGWDGLLKVIERRKLPKDAFLAAGLLKPRKSSEGCYDAFRNRLMFPISNELGNPIAFGARKINPEDEPKYLNSAESAIFQKSRTLYGLYQARRTIIEARTAIVTEGYTDVIACHQAGITNVVGTLGTALTREHARILSKLCDTVVLVFDGDEAGQRAADRALEAFFAETVDVRICVLPDKLDPDDLLRRENGREQFLNAVRSAEDALAYKVKRFHVSMESIEGISARQKQLDAFLRELADLGFREMDGVRKRWVLTHLADLLGVTVNDLQHSMPMARQRTTHDAQNTRMPQPPDAMVPSEAPESNNLGDLTKNPADQGTMPSRARIRAERDVLALLIYDPSLCQQLVSVGEMHHVRVAAVVKPEHFELEPIRQVAERVLEWIGAERTFTVPQLCDELDDEAARDLARTLYFEGEKRLDGSEAERGEILQHACVGLANHLALEEYDRIVRAYREEKPAGDAALRTVNELIEMRRNRMPLVAGAIMRGIRS